MGKSEDLKTLILLNTAEVITTQDPYIGQIGPNKNPLSAHFLSLAVQYMDSQTHPKKL